MMEPIRVMMADDHPMFRNGVRLLLSSLDGYEYVGEASNGSEATEMAIKLQPDVILMDIHMEGVNGIEATRQILQGSPHVAILIVTMYDDDDFVFAAMQAGARGYILKGADQEEMIRAIQAVGNGGAIFSPTIAQRLMDYFNNLKSAPLPKQLFPELTEREREILDMLASGYNNSEIAEKLVLSGKTVRNHISNIFSKLQVSDRAHAIVQAREAGLGRLE